jgi:hypothetical protein
VFTNKPRFVSWKVLLAFVLDALRRSIGSPHTNSSEASSQLSLGPVSATYVLPLGISQHVFMPASTRYPECTVCGDGLDLQPARSA